VNSITSHDIDRFVQFTLYTHHKDEALNLENSNPKVTMTCGGSCSKDCPAYSDTTWGTFSDGPGIYKNNEDCWWLLTTLPGIEIQVSFPFFNTESGYDFVSIYRCSSASCSATEQLAHLSGTLSADAVYATSTGFLKVVFTSDTSVTRPGFTGTWKITDEPSARISEYMDMDDPSTMAVDPGVRIYPVPTGTNFASRDPTNANRGSCVGQYEDGYYHTKVEWYALKINIATLRVDVSDHTFANTISGSGLIDMGEAGDCGGQIGAQLSLGQYSVLGTSMIDLRGTPFAVEDNGMGTIQCSEQPGGLSKAQCSQWHLTGLDAAMEVSCSHQNQLCDIRCGGNNGWCTLAAGYLQLKVLDSQDSQKRDVNFTEYESFMEAMLVLFGTGSSPQDIDSL